MGMNGFEKNAAILSMTSICYAEKKNTTGALLKPNIDRAQCINNINNYNIIIVVCEGAWFSSGG